MCPRSGFGYCRTVFVPLIQFLASFLVLVFGGPGTSVKTTLLETTLPCPSFPWCFCFLGICLAVDFLGFFEHFCLLYRDFKGSQSEKSFKFQGFAVRKILHVFKGFPCFFVQKDQGKEGQGFANLRRGVRHKEFGKKTWQKRQKKWPKGDEKCNKVIKLPLLTFCGTLIWALMGWYSAFQNDYIRP